MTLATLGWAAVAIVGLAMWTFGWRLADAAIADPTPNRRFSGVVLIAIGMGVHSLAIRHAWAPTLVIDVIATVGVVVIYVGRCVRRQP